MATTFLATLLIPLHYAIYLGVALSIGIFLYESSQIHLSYLVINDRDQVAEKPLDSLYECCPEIAVISVEGSLYFGAVGELEKAIQRCQEARVKVLILRLRQMHALGSTGVTALQWAIQASRKQGMQILLSGVKPEDRAVLAAGGIIKLVGEDCVFATEEVLFGATQRAVEKARRLVEQKQS
jgi:SulP family sulfate permease